MVWKWNTTEKKFSYLIDLRTYFWETTIFWYCYQCSRHVFVVSASNNWCDNRDLRGERTKCRSREKTYTGKSNLCGKHLVVLLLQTPDQTECCFVMSHDFTISAMNLNIYSRMERACFVTLFVSMMTYVETSRTLKILSDEYTTTIAQTYLFTFNSFPQEKTGIKFHWWI